MSRSVRLTISLPEELADYTAELAARQNVARSRVIAAIITSSKEEAFRQAMKEGYLAMADEMLETAAEVLPLFAEILDPYDGDDAPVRRRSTEAAEGRPHYG